MKSAEGGARAAVGGSPSLGVGDRHPPDQLRVGLGASAPSLAVGDSSPAPPAPSLAVGDSLPPRRNAPVLEPGSELAKLANVVHRLETFPAKNLDSPPRIGTVAATWIALAILIVAIIAVVWIDRKSVV